VQGLPPLFKGLIDPRVHARQAKPARDHHGGRLSDVSLTDALRLIRCGKSAVSSPAIDFTSISARYIFRFLRLEPRLHARQKLDALTYRGRFQRETILLLARSKNAAFIYLAIRGEN
jgi:hypothetical protein